MIVITIITLIQFNSITAQKLCLNDHLAPSLFVMGPQKTGTTSLASDLKRAFDEIATGRPLLGDPPFFWKEKHYFGGDYVDYYGDLEHYLEHYPKCESEPYQLSADCTPMLSYPLAASRIEETYREQSGRLFFVATLRDPIERLISEYHFMSTHFIKSRRFLLWIDFDEYVAGHPESKSWDSWTIHFQTRDKHLNESLTSLEAERLFIPWLESQLALASSCMKRDKILKSELWPQCGKRGLFRSMYSSQLEYWWKHIPSYQDQFVVFPMKYYFDHPNTVLRQLGQRLNLCSSSLQKRRKMSDIVLSPSPLLLSSCDRIFVSNVTHANADSYQKQSYLRMLSDSLMSDSLREFYKNFNEALLKMVMYDQNSDVFWGDVTYYSFLNHE